MASHLDMNLPIEEIKGFSVGKMVLFTAVTIQSKAGESYRLPRKKLQDWLRQASVQRAAG